MYKISFKFFTIMEINKIEIGFIVWVHLTIKFIMQIKKLKQVFSFKINLILNIYIVSCNKH